MIFNKLYMRSSGFVWVLIYYLKRFRKIFLYQINISGKDRIGEFTLASAMHDYSVIIHHGQDNAKFPINRQIFQQSIDPQPDPVSHPLFSTTIGKTRLLGEPLTPCLGERVLARESFECVRLSSATYSSVIRQPLRDIHPKKFPGQYYSLIGHWTITPNYYHWLMDVLPMVELMDNPECKILIRTPRRSYERETLEELGIWNRCVPYDGDNAVVENFHFVSHPSWSVSCNPHTVRFLRHRFRHLMQSDGDPVKVFVSRKGTAREAYNEAEVEEQFRNAGWLVVDGSKMTFKDQVAIFSRATTVCGVHGAGLTNVLWCNEGTQFTEWFADNWLVHSNENIALINELDYRPVILHGGWGARVLIPQVQVDDLLAH